MGYPSVFSVQLLGRGGCRLKKLEKNRRVTKCAENRRNQNAQLLIFFGFRKYRLFITFDFVEAIGDAKDQIEVLKTERETYCSQQLL